MKAWSLLLCFSVAFCQAFPGTGAENHGGATHQHGHLKSRLLINSLKTPVKVDGDHEFIPPNFSAGHQRGPCPALNALANHGYINRDGVTGLLETSLAINKVFGMALDLSTILSTMGTVWSGNAISLNPSFSIGGQTTATTNLLGNLLGLLGTPRGLAGSHNFIEADSSNTRDDLYVTGDAATLNLTLFTEWYNQDPDPIGDFNMDLAADRANLRFEHSVSTNPNFWYGPFTGMIARNAGYIFAGRILSNHSVERPEGHLTKEIIKSFWAVSGEPGSFTYNRGCERIPTNWYKTPVDFTLVDLNLEIIKMVEKYPVLGSIGGNTGKVNNFSGVDLSNLTGGILNTATLLQSNNLLCFAFQIVKTVAPSSLATIFSLISKPLQVMTDALDVAVLKLTCPALEDITVDGKDFEENLKGRFPGVNMSGGAF